MPTANLYVGPQDGWVQIAAAGSTFTHVSAFPHTHPYFLYAGSSAPSLVGSVGTGTVTFTTGVPTANQTITIGSEVYKFVAAAVNPFEVTIGGTNLVTATNFAAIVNAQSKLVNASNATGTVTITAKLVGAGGNYTLVTTATNTTVSGATLTGGALPVVGVLTCHKPYWNNTTSSDNLYARVQSPVPNSTHSSGRLRLDIITEGVFSAPIVPFNNAAAGTSASFTLTGGLYQLAVTATSFGSLIMNELGPDGVTWLSVSQAQTANGGQIMYLPPGMYQLVSTGGSGYTATVTQIPGV